VAVACTAALERRSRYGTQSRIVVVVVQDQALNLDETQPLVFAHERKFKDINLRLLSVSHWSLFATALKELSLRQVVLRQIDPPEPGPHPFEWVTCMIPGVLANGPNSFMRTCLKTVEDPNAALALFDSEVRPVAWPPLSSKPVLSGG
jgi:hypothetical protein